MISRLLHYHLGALLKGCFTAIIILIGSGCSILEVADETANWTVEDFMNEGQAQMADSAWSGAIATYRQMLGRFPYGRYAEQAQLDIAYAYLKNSEPALAASSADQFIRMHPTHPNVDYAYYLKGLSLFEPPDGWLDVISGVNPANNDIRPVQEAFSVYQSLISRFPDSRYAPEARKRLIYIINVLAAHEAEVAQYYYAMGADVAAVNRARFILETYQNSSSVEDALGVMMLAYKRMGLVELYDDTSRLLELNFPESRYLN
ncbi:outer membrane protein assembly factor BamD [Arenicellales bacterium IMCC57338]